MATIPPVGIGRAYWEFEKTIERSETLIDLYDFLNDLENDDDDLEEDDHDFADLLRAAIVFAVAAMDAYFTDRFSELLVP